MADFLNVPIVETGEFDAVSGPISITRGRMDDMVAASRADPNFRAPIKLGHDPDQPLLDTDGLPAAGWVENLRRIGDTLVADLLEIPDKIASLMENGTLRNRSVEIMFDFKVAGKVFPAVLTGLALLGEHLPAITSLDDVVALYAKSNIKPEHENAAFSVGELSHLTADYIRKLPDMAFASKAEGGHLRQLPHHTFQQGAVDRLLVLRSITDVPNVRASVSLQRRMLKHLGNHASREGMDFKKEISEVSEALMEKELRELLGLGESGDVLDAIKGLVALSASLRTALKIGDEDDLGAALVNAVKLAEATPTPTPAPTPIPVVGESAEMTALKAENVNTLKRVIELEGTAGRTAVESVVNKAIEDGKLLPAQKEASLKLATTDRESFDALMESQPTGVVELGARGSEGATSVDMAAIEPTEAQWKTAEEMNIATPEHRLSLMRANAAAKNMTLPANFGQEKEKEKETAKA